MSWNLALALADRALSADDLAALGYTLTDEPVSYEAASSSALAEFGTIGVLPHPRGSLLVCPDPSFADAVVRGENGGVADWVALGAAGTADVCFFGVTGAGELARQLIAVAGEVHADEGEPLPGEPGPTIDGDLVSERYLDWFLTEFDVAAGAPNGDLALYEGVVARPITQ